MITKIQKKIIPCNLIMEIGENENFDNIENWIKKSIRDDFMSYIDNGGFDYKKDLTEVGKQFKHHISCIKKLTALVKETQERNENLELAMQFQSRQIESICREIIMLKEED